MAAKKGIPGGRFLTDLRDGKDDVARVTTALKMVDAARAFSERGRLMAMQGYAYKHNQYRHAFEGSPTRRDTRLVKEREKQKTSYYHSINWTLGAGLNRLSKNLSFDLDPVFTMDTGREADRVVAELSQRSWKKLIEESLGSVREELEDTRTFIGRAIVKTVWNPRGGIAIRTAKEIDQRTDYFLREEPKHRVNLGKVKLFKGKKRYYQAIDPETDLPIWEERMTGCPDFVVLDAMSFNLDPTAKSLGVRAANWAMDQTTLPASWFYEHYPQHATKFDLFGWTPSVALDETEMMIRSLLGIPSDGDNSAECGMLTDLYIRPIEGILPDGLNLVILSNSRTGEGEVIPLEPADKPIGTPRCDLPYTDDFFEVKDRSYWSFTLNHALSYAQRMTNTQLSLASAAAEAGAKLVIAVKSQGQDNKNKNIYATSIGGFPNGIMLVVPPDYPIEGSMQILQNQSTIQPQGWMLDKTIQLAQASTAHAGAASPHAEDFSSQVVRAMQSDATFQGTINRRSWHGYQRLITLSEELIQQHCSEDDLVFGLLAEKDKENRLSAVRKFRMADLRGHLKIEPKYGLATESDEAMLMELFKFNAQNGGQATDPQEIMDLIMRRRKFGTTGRDVNVDRANEENDLMWTKKVMPDRQNDHRAHLYTHRIYYNSHYWEMSDAQRTNFRQHIEGHEDLELKVAAERTKKIAEVRAEVEADIAAMTGVAPTASRGKKAGAVQRPARSPMPARFREATGTNPGSPEDTQ